MDNSQLILRGILLVSILVMLFFSQRYWFRLAGRLRKRVSHEGLRRVLRYLLFGLAVFMMAIVVSLFLGGPLRRLSLFPMLGLWLFTSLFAWMGIKLVHGAEWAWKRLSRRFHGVEQAASIAAELIGQPASPSRRQFFQTATYFAGAVPFVGAVYGFAAERLRFTVENVEVPLVNLPNALEGMRIAQISDIHLSAFMSREQVSRAVDMTNDLGAELAVVTGDFITSRLDPLADCVAEMARLRAPLGVWGCLGNHEIYAECEDEATLLLHRVGVRVLRRANAEIVRNGQAFNLIGVDYQRTRGLNGRKLPMLAGVEPLVRRDVPNILLSHNPNAFDRAAELGIELTLAGHTHGGQVNVEILESQINPARFMTDYIAGMYSKNSQIEQRTSHLYVNRGIGTVGAPLRVGAPPEITLFTLRRG